MAHPGTTAEPTDLRNDREVQETMDREVQETMQPNPRATLQGGPRTISLVPATNPIRVLLVDDKVIMREGVRALLEQEPGLDVVAQAASVAEAIGLDVRPDVVVTDLALPDARGNAVVDGLRRRFPRAAIFVLIDREQSLADEIVTGSHDSGIRGYALKTATAREFVSGLRTVAQGVPYVQPSLRPGFAGRDPAPADRVGTGRGASGSQAPCVGRPRAIDSLTEKERDVLQLLVLGHTNNEIATLSAVSLRTVEARRARVLQKLGVRTRAELVRAVRQVG